MAGRRVLYWIRHQSSDVSISHLAPGCARGGAHRGLRHSGWRSAEDGNLRIRALLAAFLSRSRVVSQSTELDDRTLARRHHLRRAGFADAERHEKTGGVLVRQPPGFLHTGNLCAESVGIDRISAAAD